MPLSNTLGGASTFTKRRQTVKNAKIIKAEHLVKVLGLQNKFIDAVIRAIDLVSDQIKTMFGFNSENFELFKGNCLKVLDEMRENIISDIAGIYSNHFTEKEIEQMALCPTGPVEKKMVKLQPVIDKEIDELVKRYFTKVAGEVMD